MNKEIRKMYTISKAILIVLVVFAHATRMYTDVGAFSPVRQSEVLKNVTTFIYQFHMPVFMCVSGAIYGYGIDSGKYEKYFKFVGQKFKRLIIPYLFVGILIVVPTVKYTGLDNKTFLNQVLYNIILAKDNRHLWYIIALFWIFVLCGLFRKVLRRDSIIIFGIVFVVAYVLRRYAYLVNVLALGSALTYFIYFIMGIYFNKVLNKLMKKGIKWNKYRFLVYILLGLSGAAMVLNVYSKFCKDLVAAGFGMVFVFALSFILTCEDKSGRADKIWAHIGRSSYGVYLFHPMIIYILYYFLHQKNIEPWVCASVVAALSWGVSEILIWIIRKIPGLKVLIGE